MLRLPGNLNAMNPRYNITIKANSCYGRTQTSRQSSPPLKMEPSEEHVSLGRPDRELVTTFAVIISGVVEPYALISILSSLLLRIFMFIALLQLVSILLHSSICILRVKEKQLFWVSVVA